MEPITKIFSFNNQCIPNTKKENKEWAVVTGATDGIGLEFSLQLASKGYNILLIGRDNIKLYKVENEIKNKFNNTVLVKSATVDFTNPKNFFKRLVDIAIDINVSVVINNVGMSYEHPCYFVENSIEIYDNMINCNIVPMINFTYLFMYIYLTKNKGVYIKRNKRLYILNVSSILGYINAPLLSVYGATKSFISKLTTDLQQEVKLIKRDIDPKSQITIEQITPWLISTKMSQVKPSIFAPDSKTYVHYILTYGKYIPHEILTFLIKLPLIGKFIETKLTEKMVKSRARNFKSKYLKNYKEEEKEEEKKED
ncbi:hypothetical protein [Dasineura jujubifolia toursvirus 2a]|nr:hypothetical protein [Dasineura jujubifolia toursvirus 2a]